MAEKTMFVREPESTWPRIGDTVAIVADPTPGRYALCRSPQGDANVSVPVSSVDPSNARIGDSGIVRRIKRSDTIQNEPIGFVLIETP